MGVIYNSTLRTTRMQDVVAAIGSNGKLKITTASNSVLVTLPLAATAGTVSGDTLTFNTITSANATADGVAALAIVTTSADITVISGLTVGVGTGNIQLNTTAIALGASISISSGTITHNTAG